MSSVLGLLLPVAGVLFKYLFQSKVDIDSKCFKLNYQVTFCILLASSIFVTTTSSTPFGHPIVCNSDKVMSEVMNNHCWGKPYYSKVCKYDFLMGF
jgi:hypothetical protein